MSKSNMRFVVFVTIVGCSNSKVSVDLDRFELAPDQRTRVEGVEEAGGTATGEYTYDATSGVLAITLDSSSFECEGKPAEGDVITATVLLLNATTMTWDLEGEEVSLSRVDSAAQGLSGVWETADDNGDLLFILLSDDGSGGIVGEESCVVREKSEHNCDIVAPGNASITIDGDLNDWETVGSAATVMDSQGDNGTGGPGGDIKALRVATGSDALFLLVEFYAAPVIGANERFEIVVQEGSDGGSGGSEIYEIVYNEIGQVWESVGVNAGNGQFAVGATGIEWEVPLFSSGNVSNIFPQVKGNTSTADTLDVCGAIKLR